MVAVLLLFPRDRTEFAREYPIATKRVLRAILKAVDLCVSDPSGSRNCWSIGLHDAL